MKRRNLSNFREESTSKDRRLVTESNFTNDDTLRNEDDEDEQQRVELILVDFRNDENQKRLRNKFSLQVKGKLLWLENKMVKNICTNFIPIEFAKDVEYICRYYTVMFEKGYFNVNLEEISGDALRDPDVLITLARIDSVVTSVEAILENEKEVLKRLLHKYTLDAMLKYPALYSTLNDLVFEFDENDSCYPFLIKLFNEAVQELKNPKHIFKVLEEGASKYYPYTLFLKNRKVMLANACKYGLHTVHSQFFDDEEFVLEVFQKNKDKHREVMPVIRNFEPNAELVLKMIDISPHLFVYAPKSLRKDSSFLLKAIQVNPESISFASLIDTDFISSAIDISVEVLNYIEISPFVMDILEKKVKNESNQDCTLNIMAFNPSLLKYVDSNLIDRDFIVNFFKKIEKLNQKRKTLDLSIFEHYLTNEMRQDEELLLQFISMDWKSLRFASDNLQNDKSFLLKALKSNKKSSKHFPSELLDDKEFILECLKVAKSIFKRVSTRLKDDEVIVSNAITEDSYHLKHASERLRSDKNLLFVLQRKSLLYPYDCSDTLEDDKDFILELIKNGDVSHWLYEYVSDGPNIYSDPEFLLEVMANITYAYGLVLPKSISSNRDFAIRAVRLGANLRTFGKTIRNDNEIQEEAAKYQGFCLNFSEELFNLRMEHKYFGCKIQK